MEFYFNSKNPIDIEIKNILNDLCEYLFECQFSELKEIKVKNNNKKDIWIYLPKEFSISNLEQNSEHGKWYKELRKIATIVKEQGITILPIIKKTN